MAEKVNRKRSKNVSFRLTPEEYDLLMQNVSASGLSLSGYAVETLIKNRATITNTDSLKQAMVEVRRVGNNLNQLAHRANMGEFIGLPEIEAMKGEYDEVWQQLRQCLQELQ